MGRGDLTNKQWARLAPLLPRGKKSGRPPTWTKRQLIDGIRWRTRTGAPWRDVPARYGSWQRIYGLFRAWQRDSTWAAILAELHGLAEAKDLITWDVSVDSTINRAHQHAAGARPDRRPARGQPPVHHRPGPHPSQPARTRPAALPPGSGTGRQGLLQSRQPGLPAPTPHPRGHPRQTRPAGP